MKGARISLGNNELRILREKFNIDLSEPSSPGEFQEASLETLIRISELDRKIINSLYPNRKKRIPNGPEYTLRLKAENEVSAMAKHRSGFNLCNKCMKILENGLEE
jgi:hypothetical protein